MSSAIGLFAYIDDTIKAIKLFREAGLEEFEVYSPIPSHDIEHALNEHKKREGLISAVKNRNFHVIRITAFGAIAVALFFVGLAVYTFIAYPIQQGGLPIIPLPAIGLIGGVTASLGGVIFSVVGFLFLARLPSLKLETYNIEVSNDRFAISINISTPDEQTIIRDIFARCGAEKVVEKEVEN